MTEAGPHSQPVPLDQARQQQLIQQIGRLIVHALPPAWQEATVEFRALGSHSELDARLVAPNGTVIPLAPPADAEPMFAELRDGMYEPERGTWLSALYRLHRPSSYTVDFNGDYEPSWRTRPSPGACAAELHRYPRAGANIPAWLAERANVPTATGTSTRVPAIRRAEVFDAVDDTLEPATRRPTVPPDERARLLDYLEQAPVVLAARSHDVDQLDPRRESAVPLTFHTDGTWVWPGAVGYYLREHDVPPEPDLVAHVRERSFELPEVDEHARELAVTVVADDERH